MTADLPAELRTRIEARIESESEWRPDEWDRAYINGLLDGLVWVLDQVDELTEETT